MHAEDLLKYGHGWVLMHLNDLDDKDWVTLNVCGWWSTKDIIAHLTSFEVLFSEVFEVILGSEPGPAIAMFTSEGGGVFNGKQVASRSEMSVKDLLADYTQSQAKASELLAKIPVETRRKTGIVPWYGQEYDLEDMIAYANYAHKREHCAQIAIFRDSVDPDWNKQEE